MAVISIQKRIGSSLVWSSSFVSDKNCVQACEILDIMTATWHMKENRWSAIDVIHPSEASRIEALKKLAFEVDRESALHITGPACYVLGVTD